MLRTLALAALFLAPSANGFVHHRLGVRQRQVAAAPIALAAAKGFGNSKPEPPKKPKSNGQIARDEAASNYESAANSGAPEFQVLARPFGGSEKDWTSVGFIACPRSEKPEGARAEAVAG